MTKDDAPGPEEAHLILHDSAGARDRWVRLEGERMLIGRAHGGTPEHAILIASTKVSRDHAELVRGPSGWMLSDRKSSNGTWVNGAPASGATLQHGDKIEFADVSATFHMPSADENTVVETERLAPSRRGVVIDASRRAISIDGAVVPVRLGRLEFDLLALLDGKKGAVVHHGTIVDALWGAEGKSEKDALHQLIRRVRAKLAALPLEVVAVPGVGFMLARPERASET